MSKNEVTKDDREMNRRLSASEITFSLLIAWMLGAITAYIHPNLAAVGAGILAIILIMGIID